MSLKVTLLCPSIWTYGDNVRVNRWKKVLAIRDSEYLRLTDAFSA